MSVFDSTSQDSFRLLTVMLVMSVFQKQGLNQFKDDPLLSTSNARSAFHSF